MGKRSAAAAAAVSASTRHGRRHLRSATRSTTARQSCRSQAATTEVSTNSSSGSNTSGSSSDGGGSVSTRAGRASVISSRRILPMRQAVARAATAGIPVSLVSPSVASSSSEEEVDEEEEESCCSLASSSLSSSAASEAIPAQRRVRLHPSSTPLPPVSVKQRPTTTRRCAYNLRSNNCFQPPSMEHDDQEDRRQDVEEEEDEEVHEDSSNGSTNSSKRLRSTKMKKTSNSNRNKRTNSDVRLLQAAIVVLSPLRPVVSAVAANNAANNNDNNNNSQQEMSRKLKRVAKRRIEVDASAAAAAAAAAAASSASSLSTGSTKEDEQPPLTLAAAAASASAANDVDEEERLLDQSLEESYWRLYQDCEYRDCVLRLCRQTDCVRWEDVLPADMLECLRKVGEGVYGEVYASRRGRQEVALKIFPIEGGQLVNGEPQKMFHEVLPELLISRKLSNLAYRYRRNKTGNFVQLLSAAIVRGKFHPRLAEEWEAYNDGVRASDNENPDFLPARQQWLLLEYKFAGCPLPAFRFGCYREARSVILQLALSLAAAESQFQFEHRDLHWNNVLVRPTGRAKVRYRVAEHNYAVNCEGLEVAIIDFTVSRLSPAPGYVLYIDMSGDEGIFVGEGDYQFEVYRMMRRHCGDEWRDFRPRSNLMWLHYLLDKLLTATAFPRRDPDCLAVQSELTALHDCLLGYDSCEHLVRENFYFLENALDNDAAGLE